MKKKYPKAEAVFMNPSNIKLITPGRARSGASLPQAGLGSLFYVYPL